MLGRELHKMFLERHFRFVGPRPRIEQAGAVTLAELLWPVLRKLERFRPMLDSTAYDPTAFDRDADEALRAIAMIGSWKPLDDLDAGTLKVLAERLEWSVTALMLEGEAGSRISVPLPLDADEATRSLAAALAVLGNPESSPPPQWRQREPSGHHGAFPPGVKPRRH